MTPEQKKARKALAQDYVLHLALIMRETGDSKGSALVTLYGEGRAGLAARLNAKGSAQ